MDDKKILELQKMSKQYTREEMLRLNEEEPVFKPVGDIVEDDDEEFEEQYSEKNNSSREKNYDWIIALQNVSAKYTREYMFKQISEREDIISKKLQEIEDRQFEEEISLDEYFDEYDFEIGHVGNKVKVKK